jgi:hypothetical protein
MLLDAAVLAFMFLRENKEDEPMETGGQGGHFNPPPPSPHTLILVELEIKPVPLKDLVLLIATHFLNLPPVLTTTMQQACSAGVK